VKSIATTFKPPKFNEISSLLRSKFNIRFGKFDPALIRYRDPDLMPKRVWVCRLLTQMMMEDVLIISIDESNFRSDVISKRQWQVKQLGDFDNILKKRRVNRLTISSGVRPKSKSLIYRKE
jgi:hypothetical protein